MTSEFFMFHKADLRLWALLITGVYITVRVHKPIRPVMYFPAFILQNCSAEGPQEFVMVLM